MSQIGVRRLMRDRVDIAANFKSGMVGPGGRSLEDWQSVATAVPCLVAADRAYMDAQSDGRSESEAARRYRVAFADPPVEIGQNHRLTWTTAGPGRNETHLLTVVTPLIRDTSARLWICGAEDRGGD